MSTVLSLANANFVTEQLLIGGDLASDEQTAASQLHELLEVGVTHIFDARIEWSDERFVNNLAPMIRYRHMGMDDVGQRVPAAYFEQAVTFINTAIAGGGRVLSHCHMGINRGPSVGFAALLAQGRDPIEALDAIRQAREIAWVAYAEDALRWHHQRSQTPGQLKADLTRVRRWREANQLDLARVIRQKRSTAS
jgi:dual specificity phosphatase 3